jgi:hypothetical protein
MLKKILFTLLFLLTTQVQARDIILAEKAYVDDLATKRVRPSEMAAAIAAALTNYATKSYVDKAVAQGGGSIPAWLETFRNKTQPEGTQYANTTTALLYGVMWLLGSDGHVVRGQGFCSDTSGTLAQTGNPKLYWTSDTATKNCWCRMMTPAIGPWVFRYASGSYADCNAYCAMYCAYNVSRDAAFRAAVLTPLSD